MKNTITINKKKKSSFRRKGKNLRKKTLKRYHKKSFAKGKKIKKGTNSKTRRKNGGTSPNKNQIESMFSKANKFANKYIEEKIEKNTKGGYNKKSSGGGLSIGNMWSKKTEDTKEKEEKYRIETVNNNIKDDNEPEKEKNPNLKTFIEYVIGVVSFTSANEITDEYKDTNMLESTWNALDRSFKHFFIEKKLNVDVIKSWKHMMRSGEKSNLEKLQRAYNDLKAIFTGSMFNKHVGENNSKKLEELMNKFKSDEDSATVIEDIIQSIDREFIHSDNDNNDQGDQGDQDDQDDQGDQDNQGDQDDQSKSNEPSRLSRFKSFMSRKSDKSDPIEPDVSDHDSTTDEKIMINKEKDKYVWIRVNIPKDKSVMVQSDTSGTFEETLKNIKEEPS